MIGFKKWLEVATTTGMVANVPMLLFSRSKKKTETKPKDKSKNYEKKIEDYVDGK